MNTNRFRLLLISCLFMLTANANLFSQQEIREENMKHFLERAEKYMIKDDTLFNWFDINAGGVLMYESPEEKKRDTPEFAVLWEDLNDFIQDSYTESIEWMMEHYKDIIKLRPEGYQPDSYRDWQTPPFHNWWPADSNRRTFKDLRIAIDPGHVGGTEEFARMEKKYIRMRPGVAGNPNEIAFNEGNLTMATSFALADSLKNFGIQNVLLTREGYGMTAFGKTFEEWLRDDYPAALEDYILDGELTAKEETEIRAKTKPNEIFHSVFKHAEFEERQRKIMEFKPHLILAIHYNVGESNSTDREGFLKPIQKNFCMSFVPGAWAEGEFELKQWRMQFLINLLSPDFESSVAFSKSITENLTERLKVPPVEYDTSLKYLRDYSISVPSIPAKEEEVEGVFCRNLALNRMLYGTLCFGETLYQDNRAECVALNLKTVDYHGWKGPPRVAEAASAYFSGILEFARKSGVKP